MEHTTIGRAKLQNLTWVASFIAELANLPLRREQPFVGPSAFAHKGGVHVSAVLKDSATYEHIQPEMVGNRQRVLLSDLSGRSNVSYKLDQLGVGGNLNDGARRNLLERIKQMEHDGYDFETAEGTFELLVREASQPETHLFEVISYDVTTRMPSSESGTTVTNARVRLKVGEEEVNTSETGHGPMNALDLCLRNALSPVYPEVKDVHLTDYKVRVLGGKGGTESKVRVLVEWTDHQRSWATVGISDNVIDASWHALVDALRLELMRLKEVERQPEPVGQGSI
jgi:2-isopropylmalate synthase